jgi:hypothetical protein
MSAAFVRSAILALLSLSILAGCGGGGATSSPPPAQTPPPAPTLADYTVVDLPSLPGASASQAQGLNSAGDVVGYSVMNGHATAVLWKNGGPTDLGIPDSFANAVNSSGVPRSISKVGVLCWWGMAVLDSVCLVR